MKHSCCSWRNAATMALLFAGGGAMADDAASDTVVDEDNLIAPVAVSIQDLERYVAEQQDFFLPINPPDPDFVLRQVGFPEIIAFRPEAMPAEFVKGLIARDEWSVPVYDINVEECAKTRDILFRNAANEIIFRLPPPSGYDPFLYIKSLRPGLFGGTYLSDYSQFLLRLYDPARIVIRAKLIHADDVPHYLYAKSVAESYSRTMDDLGGGMMMLMEGGLDEFRMSALSLHSDALITVALPEGFTNQVDIYTCVDLLVGTWDFAALDIPANGSNSISWTDTNVWVNGADTRFYIAGNADLDSDGDGVADAREIFVYKTDPGDSNSRPVSVSGMISYDGSETGGIRVVFVTEADSWSPSKSVWLDAAGGYTNNEISDIQAYWIKAYKDVNGNGARDTWEPWGWHQAEAITFTGDVSDVDIQIEDVPSAWGEIDYTGRATGDIIIVATTSSNGWDMMYHAVIPWIQGETETGGLVVVQFPCSFGLANLVPGVYWLKALIDIDGSGGYSFGDVYGMVAGPVTLTNRTTGLDLTLADRDADNDGMPDWWEMLHGLNPVDPEDALADGDGDGIDNGEEYAADTDPGTRDTVGAPKAKILIGESGVYRISKAALAQALNLTEAEVATNTLRVRVQGTAIPTQRDNGDLLFYGERYADIYTETNVYVVQVGPAIELPIVAVDDSEDAPMEGWTDTERVEVNGKAGYGGHHITDATVDPFFWRIFISGLTISTKSFTHSLALANVVNSDAGSLATWVHGADTSRPDHCVALEVNGVVLGTNCFYGNQYISLSAPIPAGVLLSGTNIIKFTSTPPPGTNFDSWYLDAFAVSYRCSFPTNLNHELIAPDMGTLRLDGVVLNEVNAWDVSDPVRPTLLTGYLRETNQVELIRFSNTASRLVFWRDEYAKTNAIVVPMANSTLLAPTNRADYLMVVGPGLETQAQQLADYRAAEGLEVVVAKMDTIFDVATHGRRSGESMRRFARRMLMTWELVPSYIVLVGDGSLDYRNINGNNDCLIPTEASVYIDGLFNSDFAVMDCDLDGIPDYSVGRIPTTHPSSLGAYITNLVTYEAGGDWLTNTLIVTDRPTDVLFHEQGNALHDSISNVTHVLRADIHYDDFAEARSRTTNYLSAGVGILHYFGHGLPLHFAAEVLLHRNDITNSINHAKPALFIAMACQSGMFGNPNVAQSILESMVLQPGVGAAGLAPTTLIMSGVGPIMSDELTDSIYVKRRTRLGDCFRDGVVALVMSGYPSALAGARAYQLHGDPALVIHVEEE